MHPGSFIQLICQVLIDMTPSPNLFKKKIAFILFCMFDRCAQCIVGTGVGCLDFM